MNSILFMLRKTVKNAVIDTVRHPMRLILYSALIISMIYAVVVSFSPTGKPDTAFDERILSGAYHMILYFISIPILLKGLSTGTSFFAMSDVNHIFTAPISEKKILIYGVGRQLASMLLLVVTFASYGGMAIKMFDITLANAVFLIGGIMVMLILVQIITMFIFCISSGHPRRASILKLFIFAMPVFSLAVLTVYMFSNGMTFENLYRAVTLPILDYVPITGWMHALVMGTIAGEAGTVVLYSVLLLGLVVLSIVIFGRTRLDYYEDVLGRAESYYEWRNDMRSGTVRDGSLIDSQNIDQRKLGIKHGRGASAIFFKHLREGARRSRFIFFNIKTVVLVFVALITGLVIKTAAGFLPSTVTYIAAVVICVYVQFFFSAAGDWVRELSKPYIFLIPDGAVKKLMMAGATSIIKPYIDGIAAFGLLGVVTGGNFVDIIISMIAYGSFGSVYIAANILAQRIVGMDGNRGVFITFYMSFIVLLMIPGVGAGLYAVSMLGHLTDIAATIIGIPVIIWNVFISLMIFMMCKNLLNNIE